MQPGIVDQGILVDALRQQAVVAEQLTVIRAEGDDCVVQNAFRLTCRNDLSYLIIHESHGAVVAGHGLVNLWFVEVLVVNAMALALEFGADGRFVVRAGLKRIGKSSGSYREA